MQAQKLFKASSNDGGVGLLGVWNAADVDSVSGTVGPSDARSVVGERFAMYEYFSKALKVAKKGERFPVQLGRMGYGLYYIVPIEHDFAAFGLVGKYNAPRSVLKEVWDGKKLVAITLYEGGEFRGYCLRKPKRVEVDGKEVLDFGFEGNVLRINIKQSVVKPLVKIRW